MIVLLLVLTQFPYGPSPSDSRFRLLDRCLVNCACAPMVRRLLTQARSANVTVYLIGRRGVSEAQLKNLAPASAKGTAVVALDENDALKSISQPSGPTIVLVDSHGAMTVESPLNSRFHLEQALQRLR